MTRIISNDEAHEHIDRMMDFALEQFNRRAKFTNKEEERMALQAVDTFARLVIARNDIATASRVSKHKPGDKRFVVQKYLYSK